MDNPFAKPTTNLPSIDGKEVLRVLQVTVSEDEGLIYKCLLEDGTQRDLSETSFKDAQNGIAPQDSAPTDQADAVENPAEEPAPQEMTGV